jgi:hypothetical protein
MNSSEYRKYNAINSTTLADFHTYGENIVKPIKESYNFWLGKCFEGMIREKFDEGYTLPYFPVENLNQRIVTALINEEDLEKLVRYKNDGEVYSADKGIAEQIELVKREGRSVIDKDDFELINKTITNLLTMPVLDDIIVEEFLEHAEFDRPVTWVDGDGNEFKALFDIVSTLATDDNQLISIALDIKYYANEYGFYRMYDKKLWIQERHYTEALKHYCIEKGSSPYYCMPFLVGYKDSGLTQVNIIDDNYIDRAKGKYQDLVCRYVDWKKGGKKETGHLLKRYLKIY